MSVRRATVDPDREHEKRLERARHDLELWGRWLVQRTSGALGYGRSVLADMQLAGRTSDHYQAPISETHCSWVDDAVNSLHAEARIHAKLHFGGSSATGSSRASTRSRRPPSAGTSSSRSARSPTGA
jgi:hypothetical protein